LQFATLAVPLQERVEAKKLFATKEEAVAHGAKTFEPSEDLEAAKAQAGQAASAAASAQQQTQPAAPAKPKGPSPEQLLAIKAAIANAAVSGSAALHSGYLLAMTCPPACVGCRNRLEIVVMQTVVSASLHVGALSCLHGLSQRRESPCDHLLCRRTLL